MSDDEANIDAADIEVTEPPADWSPEVVDADPEPFDVEDLDQEPGA